MIKFKSNPKKIQCKAKPVIENECENEVNWEPVEEATVHSADERTIE